LEGGIDCWREGGTVGGREGLLEGERDWWREGLVR
jgi:hypothetical protein